MISKCTLAAIAAKPLIEPFHIKIIVAALAVIAAVILLFRYFKKILRECAPENRPFLTGKIIVAVSIALAGLFIALSIVYLASALGSLPIA